MILTQTKRKITSNLPEEKSFQISTTAKAFEILSSGLYNNKEAAVIRELACNAYDAHLDAKNSDPFEVFFPTELDPTFVVKDYGTGMSENDIYELYTTYFGSDKTESNIFTGALGLGSKSPFAIADQFTVENRYKGTKSTFICFISEDGVPTISKLNEKKTDEQNGMSIVVPVPEKRVVNLLKKEAPKLLSVFKHPPICHNIEKIKSVFDKTVIKGKGWTLIKSNDWNKTSFLQANVRYQIDNDKLLELVKEVYTEDSPQFYKVYLMKDALYNADTEFLIETSNGDLNFTASREELALNAKTKKVIVDRLFASIDEYIEVTQKEIDSKTTIQEVLDTSQDSQFFLLKLHISKVKNNSYYNYVSGSYNPNCSKMSDYLQTIFTFKNKNIITYMMFSIPSDECHKIYKYEIAKIHVKKVKYNYDLKRYINSYMRFFFVRPDDNFNKNNSILRAHVLKHNWKAYVIIDQTMKQYFPDTVVFEDVSKLEDIREKKVGGAALYFTKELPLVANKRIDIPSKFSYSTLYELQEEYEGLSTIYTIRDSSDRKSVLVNDYSITRNEIYNNSIIRKLRGSVAFAKYVENNFFPCVISVNKAESKSKKFLALENMISLETILQYVANRSKHKLENALYNKSVYSKMESSVDSNNFTYKVSQYLENNGIADFITKHYPLINEYVDIMKNHSNTRNDLDNFSLFITYKFLVSPTITAKVDTKVKSIVDEVKKIVTDYPLLPMIETYGYNNSTREAILDYFKNKI